MGKFLNPAVVQSTAQTAATISAAERAPSSIRPPQVSSLPAPVLALPQPNSFQVVGVYALGAYLISIYVSDISQHVLGAKPYLSFAAGLLTLIMYLLSGNPFRALQTRTGKMWLFVMLWMLIDVPFSNWPGGSFDLLTSYFSKVHIVLFFMCAFALTIKQCRTLLYANIIGSFAALFTCFKYGAADEGGRFAIPDSFIFSNPNDLGLQLLISMGFFVFLIVTPGIARRMIGVAGFMAAFYYLLKTGSRGSLVACGAVVLFTFLFTGYRWKLFWLSIPLVAIFMTISGDLSHRFGLIFLDTSTAVTTTEQDAASVGSQIERQELFKESLKYMGTHPLFGVGPGEFINKYWLDSKQQGLHVPSLGTHNSYTQIGSECGLPVFFCFIGVIFLSLRSNLRLYRQTLKQKDLRFISNLAFCMVVTTIGFAANAFFHHVAYSVYVPELVGLSICLNLAARPYLENRGRPVIAI